MLEKIRVDKSRITFGKRVVAKSTKYSTFCMQGNGKVAEFLNRWLISHPNTLNQDHGHIITSHTPVKESRGESPVKADGRLLVIDGGLSKPYQSQTGL